MRAPEIRTLPAAALACEARWFWLNCGVFFHKKNRPRERFYLLPGQGGRNYHRKQRRFRLWAILVALIFGIVMTAIMWWQARPKH
jgi:hypothetical protein